MFELKLRDLSETKRKEMMDIFLKRKELRERMGGCPPDDERVRGHECFHCDECWIAAIENSFKVDYEEKFVKDTIYPKLEKIIVDQLDVDAINLTDNLFNDLGADSLDLVEILMAIEEEFDIHFSDEDYNKYKEPTVENIIDLLKSRI